MKMGVFFYSFIYTCLNKSNVIELQYITDTLRPGNAMLKMYFNKRKNEKVNFLNNLNIEKSFIFPK